MKHLLIIFTCLTFFSCSKEKSEIDLSGLWEGSQTMVFGESPAPKTRTDSMLLDIVHDVDELIGWNTYTNRSVEPWETTGSVKGDSVFFQTVVDFPMYSISDYKAKLSNKEKTLSGEVTSRTAGLTIKGTFILYRKKF